MAVWIKDRDSVVDMVLVLALVMAVVGVVVDLHICFQDLPCQ
jgi:hypothetical protein